MVRTPNKKVARVARTGGSKSRNASTSYGWYALLAAIVILGVSLVIYVRDERLDVTSPGDTPPLASVEGRPGDRWVEAYGFYTCDKFAPNLAPQNDPFGISTANNGIITIVPNAKEYAGRNATFGRFAQGADVQLERDSFQIPGDPNRYGPGFKCGDKDGKLVVREWKDAADVASGERIGGSPEALLLKNRAAVTIAWVPSDFDENAIPQPPSVTGLGQAATALEQGGSAPGGGEQPGAAVPGATPDPAAPGATPAQPAAPAAPAAPGQ